MTKLGQLDFETPDFERFPASGWPMRRPNLGGAHCIALNAADEIAVEAFLAGDIHFTDIPRTIEAVLQATSESHPGSIEDVLALDEHAREVSRAWLAGSSLAGAGRPLAG